MKSFSLFQTYINLNIEKGGSILCAEILSNGNIIVNRRDAQKITSVTNGLACVFDNALHRIFCKSRGCIL